jgi:phenylpyruvate tautomerase PptA (4-oxalocrotonate tautomerase family)
MPLYQVEHSSPLTRAEKNDIAASITRIHQSAFGAPSIFIGITFKDISDVEYYTGPNLKSSYNRILAIVRTGGSRTVADFNKLALALSEAWNDIVIKNDIAIGRAKRNLSGVFVLRSIEALIEHGLILPEAGTDETWLEQSITEFEKRANAGDPDFQELLVELRKPK